MVETNGSSSLQEEQFGISAGEISTGLNGVYSPAQRLQIQLDEAERLSFHPAAQIQNVTFTAPNITSEEAFPSLGSAMSSSSKPSVWGTNDSDKNLMPASSSSASKRANLSISTRSPIHHTKVNLPGNRSSPKSKALSHPTYTETVRISRHQLRQPGVQTYKDVVERIKKQLAGQGIVVDSVTVSKSTRSGEVVFTISARDKEGAGKAKGRILGEKLMTMSIPVFCTPFIIGKKGVVLRNIQDISGVKVHIPRTENVENGNAEEKLPEQNVEDEDVEIIEISLEGPEEGLNIARAEIDRIVEEKTAKVTARFSSIPPPYYLHLRPLITSYESMYPDLKIRVPAPYSAPYTLPKASTQEPIRLSGDKSVISSVRTELESYYQRLLDTCAEASVNIPVSQHKYLIGPNGQSLFDILDKIGFAMLFSEGEDQVRILGPMDKLGEGVTAVMQKAKEVNVRNVDLVSIAGGDMDHARNVWRYLFRKQYLQAVSSSYPDITLGLPKKDRTDFVIEVFGKHKMNVEKATVDVNTLITKWGKNWRHGTVNVESLWHGVLIGKGGRRRLDLEREYGVWLGFGENEECDDEILLVYEGYPDTEEAATQKIEALKQHLFKLSSDSADLKTTTLNIDTKHHALIVGPQGTTLNALIGEPTNPDAPRLRVDVGGTEFVSNKRTGSKERQRDPVVVIRGPSKDVDRVAAAILQHVEDSKHTEFLNSYVVEFKIPPEYAKNVIGKQGWRISELREKLGVQVSIGEGGEVSLKGVKKNVEETRRRIEKVVEEGKDDTLLKLDVPIELHGGLIGEKGVNVNRLQTRYSVRIQFPRAVSEDGDDPYARIPKEERPVGNQIVIRGSKTNAHKAFDELKGLAEYELARGHTGEIHISKRARDRIVRDGVLRNLANDPGFARLDIPKPVEGEGEGEDEEDKVEIKIKGTEDFVNRALKDLKAVEEDAKGEMVLRLHIDQKLHREFIGQGGNVLSQIITDAGGPEDRKLQARIVQFPGRGKVSDEIVLTGKKSVVEKIEQKLLGLSKRETIEIEVEKEKVRLIIGRGGQKRRELEKEFGVQILVPKNLGENETARVENVKIRGLPEQNEKTKAYIMELIKTPELRTEEIQVPLSIHHYLISESRIRNTLRQKFQVSITYPDVAKSKSATNGTPKIDEHVARIDDDAQYEEEEFTFDVVPPKYSGPSVSSEAVTWTIRSADGNTEQSFERAKDYLTSQIARFSEENSQYLGYLDVPSQLHHWIIGSGGNTVKRIREESGASVEVPRRGEESNKNGSVTIKGRKESVQRAKELIVEAIHAGERSRGRRGSSQNGGVHRR